MAGKVIGVGGLGLIIQQGQFAVKILRLFRKVEIDGEPTNRSLSAAEGDFDERQCKIDQIEVEKTIYRRLGSHPGIVRYFSLASSDPSIQMALMKNGDLRHYLARERPDKKIRLSWLTDLAHAFVHIHKCRVLFADIRSDNLLLDDG